jgi:Flp pilus assembly protein TadG
MFARIGSPRLNMSSNCAPVFAAWRRDERGFTAIEFAMVAMPFLMMLFGIITVGLYFFTTFTLENAVEETGRLIRTGQVQQSNMTADQFKQEVCNRLPGYVDCTMLRINVQTFAGFDTIAMPSCVDVSGKLIDSSKTSYTPGGADAVVLVTICYEWQLAGKLPFLNVSNMSDGSALLQASTTFRTEPYN